MTRLELLQLVVARARANGFQFRRWYTRHAVRPWVTANDAVEWLSIGRRPSILLFSHDFAKAFWKEGEQITFRVPVQEFQRVMPNGMVKTVKRKGYVRRSARPDVWKYHLREMAVADEPLRYIRKYMMVEEELEPETSTSSPDSSEKQS